MAGLAGVTPIEAGIGRVAEITAEVACSAA
jgi:hypothetical protein